MTPIQIAAFVALGADPGDLVDRVGERLLSEERYDGYVVLTDRGGVAEERLGVIRGWLKDAHGIDVAQVPRDFAVEQVFLVVRARVINGLTPPSIGLQFLARLWSNHQPEVSDDLKAIYALWSDADEMEEAEVVREFLEILKQEPA